MAKSYINKDLIIFQKGKTLGEICDDLSLLITKVNSLENISKSHGVCSIGVKDESGFHVNLEGNWKSSLIKLNNVRFNTNTDLYKPYDGGIKILKTGLYKLSGTINCDINRASFEFYTNLHGYMWMNDYNYNSTDMNNFSSCTLYVYAEEGEVIYLALRAPASGSFLVRPSRSVLTIERISHLGHI